MEKKAIKPRMSNPYKDLELVKHEKIRISALKEVAQLFDKELKTRKRGTTEVENYFFQNKELKTILDTHKISPAENLRIHELVVRDIENYQKDLGYVEKGKNVNIASQRNEPKSISGFYIRNTAKKLTWDMALKPAGEMTLKVIKNNKIKSACAMGFIFVIASQSFAIDKNVADISSKNKVEESISMTHDEYLGSFATPIFLKSDYDGYVEKFSSLDVNKDFKFTDPVLLENYTNTYNEYIDHIAEKKLNGVSTLSREEGMALLNLRYVSVNSFIALMKEKEKLATASERRELSKIIGKYTIDLDNIQQSIRDLRVGREKEKTRVFHSEKGNIQYQVDVNGDFLVEDVEKIRD